MTLEKVRKRDGKIVDFEQEKITEAINKAFLAKGYMAETARLLSKSLSDKVTEKLEKRFEGDVPEIEDIQDLVESTLIEENFSKVAKAYILYRKQREDVRKLKETMLEVDKVMDGYLNQVDWRVNENSNSGYSLSGLLMHAAGSVVANYVLTKVYPKEISDAHRNGDFHIHDLSMGIAGYCAGWSLKQLLVEGFNGVEGKVASSPPKHLETALGQMVNFLGTLQNEWAGAMAFSSFDTYLAPFVKVDNLSYREVKQAIQQFVFSLNVASRWGGQTPFTNITLDWVVPEDMKDEPAIVGGQLADFTYGELQNEMNIINKAFIEVMMAGDADGRPFTFPIPTYNITDDFDWDSENSNLLFEMTAKYGLPYFQNFINSELNPGDVRSMCCRLQLNLKELRAKTGGLFGSGECTGSIGVVTLDMPRIGYLSKTKEEFFERVSRLMDMAKESLEIKRKLVERNMENGLLPYTKRYLGTMNNHFSTIGLVGMNEALLNFLGKDIGSEEGKKFAVEVLNFMRDKLTQFQESTGHIYNLEATPAEGTSYRLARIDKQKYPDIITAGEDEPYYTNSTQLPVGYTDDIFEALDLQDDLQTLYTGGTVLHGFLGEELDNPESCKLLVRRIAENYRLPYYTITPTFSICKKHGYIAGEHFTCPKCGEPTEVYSRVVGYFRPVQNWNKGKKEEFKERLEFDVTKNGIRPSLIQEKHEEKKEVETTPILSSSAPSDEGGVAVETTPISPPASVSGKPSKYIFFWATHCPHCPSVKMYLDKYVDIAGERYNVDDPEGYELANKFDVIGTPTVILFDDADNQLAAVNSIGGLKKWLS